MHTVRRMIAGIGRAFISSGVLVLLFIVYELWGTSIAEARDQKVLKEKLRHLTPGLTVPATPGLTVPTTVYVPPAPPPAGDAVAMLKIDRIGLVKAIIEGTDTNDLKKGPGHYSGTPMPGEAGNVAIAGHRTTYGAPFYRINELETGDPIVLTTKQGTFHYEVTEQKVVSPDSNEVLDPTDDNRLTLTTCHPRYSASQRLIVFAKLMGDPLGKSAASGPQVGLGSITDQPAGDGSGGTVPPKGAKTVGTTTTRPAGTGAPGATPVTEAGTRTSVPGSASVAGTTRIGGVSGSTNGRGPAVTWGLISALIALITWVFAKRWRKWPAYVLGTPIFLIALFVFFENFSSLLPANV